MWSDSPQTRLGTAHVEFLILALWPHKLVQDERLGTFTGSHQYEPVFSCILLQRSCSLPGLKTRQEVRAVVAPVLSSLSAAPLCVLLSLSPLLSFEGGQEVMLLSAVVSGCSCLAACVSLLCCSWSPLHQSCGAFTVKARSEIRNAGLHSFSLHCSAERIVHIILSSNLLFAE